MKHALVRTLVMAAALLAAASCRQRETPPAPPGATEAAPRVAAEQLRMPLVKGEGQAAIADYRDKVLLVNFFAAGMEECRQEIADLNKLVADMQGRPFAVLGIAMDLKPPIYVADGMRYTAPAFPYVLGGKPGRQSFPSVRALPTKWLYDRNGNVARRYEGAASITQIRADIDELLR